LIINPRFDINSLKNPNFDFFSTYYELISKEKTKKICLVIKEEYLEKFIQNFDLKNFNSENIAKLARIF